MSTVRIQVRRGTASQWTSVNPILAAGEMGVESDTNLFKFGNGSSTWTALAYANNSDVAIGEISQDAINTALSMGAGLTKSYNDGTNTIQITVDSNVVALKSYVDNQISGLANTVDTDYIPLSDRGAFGGVASLDSSGFVPTAQLNIDERVQDVLASTIVAGRGITTTYNDSANTFTVSENITVGSGIVKTDNSSGTGITLSLPETINASTKFTSPLIEVGTVSATNVNTENITISGNLTVNGTTTTVNSTNISIDDPMIYIGENNQSNALDLGIVGAFNDGTYQHSGLVRDASDARWKLFSGVTSEPGTTIDFTTYTKDALEVGGLFADAAKIGDTTNAEIQRIHGVTSPVQTQLDSKLNVSNAESTYATKISPTFTGTVTLPAGTVTSAMIADGTIVNADINASAAIAQNKIANLVSDISAINLTISTNSSNINDLQTSAGTLSSTKAPIASPTFTGTVILPSTTSIGNVSQAEIATLDGVTSSIQTQIDNTNNSIGTAVTDIATNKSSISSIQNSVTSINTTTGSLQTQINTKASSADFTSHTSATTNVHGIADTSALALTATVNSALALKAPLASPTFTGTVNGITKSMVGLANADNTTDLGKPISTATQAALDLKAPLAAPTFTGTVVLPATTSIGNVDSTEIAYLDGVTSAVQTQINAKAPLVSPALTGTPTAPTAAAGTNTTQIATTQFVGTAVSALVAAAPAALDTLNELATALGNDASFSTTVTNSIALKAPLASPTFTGTVILPAGTITSGMILDGTIVDADINASAAIAQSKISGLSTSLGLKANLAAPSFTGGVTVDASGIVFTDGTQTRAGVPSITTIATEVTATGTLAAGEQDKFIPLSGAVVITLPATGYLNGQSIDFWQKTGTGASFANANGVIGTPGLKFRTTNSVVTAMKISSGWLVFGDLSA